MRIRNHRDFWSGIMFLVLGVLFVIFSQAYQLGTPARMGPGFFPTTLGALMALLGLAITWQSAAPGNREGRVEKVGWRELFLILFSVGVFAAALPYLGMVIAITLLIAISAVASHEFSWKETAISIVVLLVMSELVFVKGLELQFPVWPKFLTQ
ncbi:MAG: tripartite tricarboxylate transporter TctB family protein [Burkholderiales bacterium]|nr:MAG: tripartite tricarboxylate transporter TctB family protein [Burkholderiales bacterium]RPH67305.1 MAG: tripartite tricarboxylate transporter TctB family protein [Burkholderiales bacterium]